MALLGACRLTDMMPCADDKDVVHKLTAAFSSRRPPHMVHSVSAEHHAELSHPAQIRAYITPDSLNRRTQLAPDRHQNMACTTT